MEELENVQEVETTNVTEEINSENNVQEIQEEVKSETLENAPIATEKTEGKIKRFFMKIWEILKMEV